MSKGSNKGDRKCFINLIEGKYSFHVHLQAEGTVRELLRPLLRDSGTEGSHLFPRFLIKDPKLACIERR